MLEARRKGIRSQLLRESIRCEGSTSHANISVAIRESRESMKTCPPALRGASTIRVGQNQIMEGVGDNSVAVVTNTLANRWHDDPVGSAPEF